MMLIIVSIVICVVAYPTNYAWYWRAARHRHQTACSTCSRNEIEPGRGMKLAKPEGWLWRLVARRGIKHREIAGAPAVFY
jgi:hypothetical protein